jgi:hypothetical protein
MSEPVRDDVAVEKGAITQQELSEPSATPPPASVGEAGTMTAKTWFVIFILTSTFGLSFWPVPTTAAMQATLAARWDSPTSQYWFSMYPNAAMQDGSNVLQSSCFYHRMFSWISPCWITQ